MVDLEMETPFDDLKVGFGRIRNLKILLACVLKFCFERA